MRPRIWIIGTSAAAVIAGTAAGYFYLTGVLRPVSPAVACLMVHRGTWRCASYQIIVSEPFFLPAGALIGAWIAYALVRLYAAPEQRNFTGRESLATAPPLLAITAWIGALHPGVRWFWGDGLGWWQVLLFFLAAVLGRCAIGIASIANARGGLILGFGLPVIFAGLGYASITLFRLPPVGHGCPAGAPASACIFHPIIATSGPWVLLGFLAGIWLAYAVAAALAGSPRGLTGTEGAIVLPVIAAAIWWALVIGPDQAGGGYVARFVLAVCLTAVLRLLLGARTVKNAITGVLARLGMVSRMAGAPSANLRPA
jgi:hypothetical protein